MADEACVEQATGPARRRLRAGRRPTVTARPCSTRFTEDYRQYLHRPPDRPPAAHRRPRRARRWRRGSPTAESRPTSRPTPAAAPGTACVQPHPRRDPRRPPRSSRRSTTAAPTSPRSPPSGRPTPAAGAEGGELGASGRPVRRARVRGRRSSAPARRRGGGPVADRVRLPPHPGHRARGAPTIEEVRARRWPRPSREATQQRSSTWFQAPGARARSRSIPGSARLGRPSEGDGHAAGEPTATDPGELGDRPGRRRRPRAGRRPSSAPRPRSRRSTRGAGAVRAHDPPPVRVRCSATELTASTTVYERRPTFDEVYQAIVDRCWSPRRPSTARCSTPCPARRAWPSARRAAGGRGRRAASRSRCIPALSFLDLAWVRLGVDPLARGRAPRRRPPLRVDAAGERGPAARRPVRQRGACCPTSSSPSRTTRPSGR